MSLSHVAQKYGSSPEQSAAARGSIKARAAAVGFEINFNKDSRIYNTFNAHRLLHWAALEGRQTPLKSALFEAYFTDGEDPSSAEVLLEVVEKVGLDATRAKEILTSDTYAAEVRAAEDYWRTEGVSAVPAVIINDRYLISGGQPPEAFERALRSIAAES